MVSGVECETADGMWIDNSRPKAAAVTLCALSGCRTVYAADFSIFGSMMKKRFFQKQSIGFAPLASVRDWAIIAVIVAGILCLRELVLLFSLMDREDLQITLIGACFGMLPSVLMCVPVHGVVDGLSRDALRSFLESMKFIRLVEQDGTRLYTQNTPSWMRWDSNRVAVRPLPDGQLGVTMPIYCYWTLTRRR
ncbi:hypothetical protein [Massilia phosphatilytica]